MAATMNTAQRFARITTLVAKAKQLIADYPSYPLVLAQCITSVKNALKAEPWPANSAEPRIPGWFLDCARAILGVLPRCAWAELQQTTHVWVDFDYEECDDDCECEYCEADLPIVVNVPAAWLAEPVAPAAVLDMCDDPC